MVDELNSSVVDFGIFANTSQFEHSINLADATVVECINAYIDVKIKANPNIHKQYSHTLLHIKNIEKQWNVTLYPVVVGDLFWSNFHKHLLDKDFSTSTINGISQKIACVLKWSAKYGAKISPTLEENQIQASSKKPLISLSQDEVSRITYFDIDSITELRADRRENLKRVRDQFVLACFLGQRYSDTKRINPECFRDSIFEIVQQKTGNRAVVDIKKITAYPKVVQEILKRYDYKAPFPYDIGMYNKALHQLFYYAGFDNEIKYERKVRGKIITKTYKLYELITSHTARRTMITNCVQRGIHTEQIRRASGHQSESSFAKYVKWND